MDGAHNAGLMIGAILGLLVVLAAVVPVIVSIVQSHRYPTGIKALWVLTVLASPILGSSMCFSLRVHR